MGIHNKLDLTGQKFGKLLVLGISHKTERGEILWLCQCECGNYSTPSASALKKGNSTTCGCGRLRAITTHGMTGSRTFKTWESMKLRCTNPDDPSYARYGGRGIKVCDRWLQSFENFLKDMGERPPNKTLDRRNTHGHYEPGNCRWATPLEQQANRDATRKLTHDGRTLTLAEWSERVGIPAKTLRSRCRAGWPVEKTLSEPVMPGRGKKRLSF